MKNNNKSVTLLELLIAMSLLTLIVFAAGGIYLSGWGMFRDAQLMAQAQRNAMVPMAHMQKHLQQAASDFVNWPGFFGANILFCPVYTQVPEQFNSHPSNTAAYIYDLDGSDRIRYIDTAENEHIIATHITACNFTVDHILQEDSGASSGTVVNITITATDNTGQHSYTLNSSVRGLLTAIPCGDPFHV